MPVAVQPRQTRHLRDQHEADLAQSDRGDQALEARAHVAAGAGQAEILVNDLDPRRRPAHLLRPFGELVLWVIERFTGCVRFRRRTATWCASEMAARASTTAGIWALFLIGRCRAMTHASDARR